MLGGSEMRTMASLLGATCKVLRIDGSIWLWGLIAIPEAVPGVSMPSTNP
jgi:hypothetical protein